MVVVCLATAKHYLRHRLGHRVLSRDSSSQDDRLPLGKKKRKDERVAERTGDLERVTRTIITAGQAHKNEQVNVSNLDVDISQFPLALLLQVPGPLEIRLFLGRLDRHGKFCRTRFLTAERDTCDGNRPRSFWIQMKI